MNKVVPDELILFDTICLRVEFVTDDFCWRLQNGQNGSARLLYSCQLILDRTELLYRLVLQLTESTSHVSVQLL